MKTINKIVLFISLSLIIFSCHTSELENIIYIKIKGSDTMLILTRLWAQEYMKQNKHISIYTEGGGSATGFRALIDGEADICAASRPMRAAEVRLLAEQHSKLGIAFMVAKDALSIYLHPQNPIQDLTSNQLKDIYTGKITNWKEVGGEDEKILVLNRSPNSGTYIYFNDHVMSGEPFQSNSVTLPSTNAIVKMVEANKNAIGYGGTAYGENVKHCKVDNIDPTIENVRNNTYPISRYLYLYTIDNPKGAVKDFIDWVSSMPGQSIVAKVGYIPLWNSNSN